jgi:DNA-binding transcriptional LysR family regulator
LLKHIERYREMYPKIKVQIRRSLSSKLPNELLDGNLELGVISRRRGRAGRAVSSFVATPRAS